MSNSRSLWVWCGVVTFSAAVASGGLAQAPSPAASSESGAEAPPAKAPKLQAEAALRRVRTELSDGGLVLRKKPTLGAPDSYRFIVRAAPACLGFFADITPSASPAGLANLAGAPQGPDFTDPYPGTRLFAPPAMSAEAYFEQLSVDRRKTRPPEATRLAELVWLSLDRDGDGRLGSGDSDAEGNFSLRQQVFSSRVTDTAVQTDKSDEELVGGIVANSGATANESPPERPLFSYRLSEARLEFDLNADGDQTDELIFGDANSDGQLQPEETRKLWAAGPEADFTEQLSLDPRLAGPAGDLEARLTARFPALAPEARARALHGGITRIEQSLMLESEDPRGGRRRGRVGGSMDVRNVLDRLLALSR